MDNIRNFLKKSIDDHPDHDLQFTVKDWETDFLRFYDSQTNYNISKASLTVSGTIVKDKRKYSFSLSNPTEDQLKKTIAEGIRIIPSLPQDPDFDSFEDDKTAYKYGEKKTSIEKVSLENKLDILKKLADMADKHGFGIYGTFITMKHQGYIINSEGIDKEIFISPVMLDVKAVARKNMVTVIHSFGGNDLTYFDEPGFASTFEAKIKKAALDVVDVEPGDYKVILGPHAASELLNYMLFGAYAASVDRGDSYFKDLKDKKVFPESFSVTSDPENPRLITIPYNEDGHIARKLDVIDKGVFKNFFVDHYFSKKLGMEKSGTVGLGAVTVDEGDKTLEELISGIDRGLYISNVHYMNFINQQETSVTGLTRDGTFLIENGKITKVVNNLRFTEKIAEIFRNASGIENVQNPVPHSENYGEFEIYSSLIPHIMSDKFKITSSTKTI